MVAVTTAPPAPPVVVARPNASTAAKPSTPEVTTGARELELLDDLELEDTEDKLELRELELIDEILELRELELIEDETELDRELEERVTELVELWVLGREHSLTPPAIRPPKVASEQTNVPLNVL